MAKSAVKTPFNLNCAMTTTLPESQSLIEHILSNTSKVFSPPTSAMKVVEMADREDTSPAELKELIESDPALTVRILKIVNSGAFGEKQNIVDVGQAIAMLGIRAVRLLALGFSLPREELDSDSAELNQLNWRYSVVKAVTARYLMDEFHHNLESDIAFIAGLLQDMGVSILMHELGEPYTEFLHEVHGNGKNLNDLEIDSLGFSHKQLTAKLLDQWHLPESIVLAVGQSFEPTVIKNLGSPEKETAQALHLAELVAQVVTYQNEDSARKFLAHGENYLKLTTSQAKSILAEMIEQATQLARSMEVEIGQIDSHEEILSRAQQHLAKMSEEQIRESILGHTNTKNVRSSDIETILKNKASASKNNSGKPSTDSSISFNAASCDLSRQIVRTASEARDQYAPISLVLVAVSNNNMVGSEGFAKKSEFVLKHITQQVWEQEGVVMSLANGGIAVLAKQERRSCVELMRQVGHSVEAWNRIQLQRDGETIVFQTGIACLSMVPRNMEHGQLLNAAQRCLDSAKTSDTNSIKSIDVL